MTRQVGSNVTISPSCSMVSAASWPPVTIAVRIADTATGSAHPS